MKDGVMGSGKVRSSNMELLRIVAMFMIVMYHISYHCVRFQLVDKNSIDRMANGLFCYPDFYKTVSCRRSHAARCNRQ